MFRKSQPPPFYLLRWFSIFLFLLSLAAMVCAGLIYSEIRGLEARLLPGTWEAMMLDQGVPQGMHFALSVVVSLSLAFLAAIVFAGAALAERLVASP